MVAHDDGVDHAERIERVLVLTKDAELRRPDDLTALRRLFAGQQLHEGRLPGAVRSRQAIPAAGGERGGDVVEEDLRPEAHRHTLHCNHRETRSLGSTPGAL